MRHGRTSSGDHYYEDVDPRFAEPPTNPSLVPAALTINHSPGSKSNSPIPPPLNTLDGGNSYEDVQSGSRSPAESERSNFTSVSQRGVNPRWNEGYGAQMPARRPVPPRNDVLNSNPDFQLPGGRGGRNGAPGRAPGQIPGMGGGMVPGSAYPGGGTL